MICGIRTIAPVLSSLVLLAASVSQVQAQQKTVAVLSISSVDDVLGNIKYLTESAGSGELGQMATLTLGAYLEGVDRGNPVGMVLNTDGRDFTPLGFIPVKDLDAVFAALEDTVGTPNDAGDGIKEIAGFPTVYVKEQGGYAFVGQTIESMKNLPQNPVLSLGNLPKEYDFAIRGFAQNVPEEYLQMAVQGLQQGVKQGLESLPEEDKAQQQRMIELQLKQMESYIKESDQLTLGWKTEPENQRTYIDITLSAIAGSDLAKQMNAMADATSDYTGFILPGSAVALNFSGEVPEEQIQTSIDAIEGMKAAALKEIARDENLDEKGAREAATEMLGAAIDIFIDTIKTGKMDAAASLVLEPGNPQLLGGFHVANGKSVEDMLRRIAELAKDEPNFPGIKFDADKANGVAYHTMSVPIPAGEADARKIIGDTLEVAVGVGPTSAYIGVGRNCVNSLKGIIGKQQKSQKCTPFELTVSVTPIMEFVNSIEPNPLIGAVMDALKDQENDHVRLSVLPVENGFRYRIEMEEGVLQAIGAGIRMAGSSF